MTDLTKVVGELQKYLRFGDDLWAGEGVNHLYKWPGGSSGSTIALGIDLGFSHKQFDKIVVEPLLTRRPELKGEFDVLRSLFYGTTGQAAKFRIGAYPTLLRKLDAIIYENCEKELRDLDVKFVTKFVLNVNDICPLEKLPLWPVVAIASMFFNRGTSVTGDSRREVRAVVEALAAVKHGTMTIPQFRAKVRAEIISMKRLWMKSNLSGLLKRRDSEARLVSKFEESVDSE